MIFNLNAGGGTFKSIKPPTMETLANELKKVTKKITPPYDGRCAA